MAATGPDVERLPSPWFGVFLPQLRMDYATILRRTRVAEEAGFDSVWLMDHMAAPMAPEYDAFEGWTLATALGTATERIRVGHLVLCDAFRHPALLAKMAATLDVVTDGRLELGIGWGSAPAELDTYGFGETTPARRAARLAETLGILEKMFAGETFDHDGEFFRITGGMGRPRPVRGRVPIHIGGAGPTLTMPLVAEHADWWNLPSYAHRKLDELRPLAGPARISVQHPVGLAGSATARDEVHDVAYRRFGKWGGLLTGTPDEVAAPLAGLAASGVEGFVIQFHDFGDEESLRLFMADVAPAVREAAQAPTH